ncbi:glycosyl transferase [Marinobacterium nitratireducens]|uniref:Glycosyl transferase n=1 Tax=Marinobacterium nitratireducens TaxID=518897 RepID=A0A917Z9R6_9GAMM|nr:glycosyltransferase [Marinobacterium nitratireducens]GGO77995.1 glycosyl transferase [Marinobacterium nitratireducens]
MTDSPIRVAQVLAGAAQGGAENFFVRLVAGLQEHPSLDVKAFIRDHAHRVESLRQAGVETQGFRFGSALDLLDRHHFRRALKDYAPEIVMTWMGRASAYTPHSKDYLLVNRLGHYYKLKYYSHADYWVGISKGICKHMIDGGFPAERVVHIPNFADEREVEPLPRDSFDTPADKPLILSAGRLHVNKAFDVLLHSLAALPDVTLWLAGSGPEEQNLKALCAKLGLESRVRFLGWRTDVTALMRTADLFVCPSRHEGLGSIVMESWAHRCPIVATDSQGPGEAITDGVSGLITPVDDADALAKAIDSVLKSDDLRTRLIEGASEVYANGYSKKYIVERYNEFYHQIRR